MFRNDNKKLAPNPNRTTPQNLQYPSSNTSPDLAPGTSMNVSSAAINVASNLKNVNMKQKNLKQQQQIAKRQSQPLAQSLTPNSRFQILWN